MTQLKAIFAVAALGAALSLSSTPALAVNCGESLDIVFSTYEASGSDPVMLSDEEIGAAMEQFEIADVSRGFYVEVQAHMLLGLEVDGCLLPPIEMTAPLKGTKLSGATAFGIYA